MAFEVNQGVLGLTCLAYAGIIIAILRNRVYKQPGYGLFLGFTIFLLIGMLARLGMAYSPLASAFRNESLQRIPAYLAFVSAFLLSEITVTFLHNRRLHWSWKIVTVIYLAWAIVWSENIQERFLNEFQVGGVLFERAGSGMALLIAGWAFFSAKAAGSTLVTRRRALHPLHRNRDSLWLAGVLLNVLGVGLMLADALGLPVGEMVLWLATGSMAYLFFTHDLPDIRAIVRHSFSALVSVLLSVAIYALFFFFIKSFLQTTENNLDGVIQAVVVAAIITLLLHPITRLIQRSISRVFVERGTDPGQLQGEYSKKIANIIDLAHLAEVITQMIVNGLHIRHARLFLVSQQEDAYLLAEVSSIQSGEEPVKVRIAQASPLAGYLNFERKPLGQYDIDLLARFRGAPVEEMVALKNLAIDVYVSVFIQGRWIGLLGLGTKKSGDRFYEKELDLLEALADQTAVALENARLYEDLKGRNADNERLNRDLTAANLELSRLDKAKSDFINIASHELRTPLTQIIGYNDILEDMMGKGTVSQDDSQAMTQGVRKAARRLEEIVNTMFDVSKLDTSTMELSMGSVPLIPTIEAALEKWKQALELRQLNLIVQDLEGLPLLMGDGKRLVQVFSALIQNAIKFTPDGGEIRISASCIASEAADGPAYVEVIVADTGIGIAADELERIFEKFYRVGNVLLHSSGDVKFKGAGPGLGLTICRGIVEAHGGRVWAESAGCDTGSSFHVVLKAAPEHI
jgi:signal transduction histidine kinase